MNQHSAVARLVALNDAQPDPGIGLRRQLIEIGGEQLGACAFRLQQQIQQAAEFVSRHLDRVVHTIEAGTASCRAKLHSANSQLSRTSTVPSTYPERRDW